MFFCVIRCMYHIIRSYNIFLTKFGQICNLFYLYKALSLVAYNIKHNFNFKYLCDVKVMAKETKSEK